MRGGLLGIAAVGVSLGAAGCASPGQPPAAADRAEGWWVADGVPCVLQEEEADCGAAALAAVLTAWELPTQVADVARALPRRPGRGHEAGALRDHAQALGLAAFVVRGEIADLRHELERRRPVIVGLMKPVAGGALPHYEVVVGLHARGDVATLDPARGWVRRDAAAFGDAWGRAGNVTVVVFREEPAHGPPEKEVGPR
ncbi:MAG: cysteine peptidase family C39 domain-containing protein [Planctomycetes bacterium]|nr:cysteine peptidase family C39 domain-containing protein [Planctomycetota bacterium]